jgi:methylated-DNA-[protein]-cysteine S-methyltransferase
MRLIEYLNHFIYIFIMKKSFDKRCYELLKEVPLGKVTTYREIARRLDCDSYRRVGLALKKNKNIVIIPCHRVVCSDGRIGGYNMGIEKKIKLLRNEGIKIVNDKIDLKKFGYYFK